MKHAIGEAALAAFVLAGCNAELKTAEDLGPDGGTVLDAGSKVSDTGDADTKAAGSGGPYCVGGEDVWFGYTNISTGPMSSGPLLSAEAVFVESYGMSFFFIDRGCKFYVSSRADGVVYRGVLDEQMAASVAARLHHDQIAQTVDYLDHGCPASNLASVHVPGAAGACACGCDADAPASLSAALAEIPSVLEELLAQATRLRGPVGVVATMLDESWAESYEGVSWPLSTPIAEIPGMLHDRVGGRLSTEEFASFEGHDAEVLRALRETAAVEELAWPAPTVLVSEGDDLYSLGIRDALPPEDEMAIETFLSNSRGAGSWGVFRP